MPSRGQHVHNHYIVHPLHRAYYINISVCYIACQPKQPGICESTMRSQIIIQTYGHESQALSETKSAPRTSNTMSEFWAIVSMYKDVYMRDTTPATRNSLFMLKCLQTDLKGYFEFQQQNC